MNEFGADLAYSHAASHAEFWGKVYAKAFPDMACLMENDANNSAQRLGIDRVVLLNSGRALYIDEKKRRKDYGDILLEVESNSATGAPGWMEKDLAIDFLAYAFMPEERVYLLQWDMLRRVWANFREEWKRLAGSASQGFNLVRAENPGYVTTSIAVPTEVLLARMKGAQVIEL